MSSITVKDFGSSISKSQKAIFLAGPIIEKPGLEPWDLRAIDILEKEDYHGIVYRAHNIGSVDSKQLDWIIKARKNSKVIAIWIEDKILEKDIPSELLMLRQLLKTHKVLYGNSVKNNVTFHYDNLYKRLLKEQDGIKHQIENNLESLILKSAMAADFKMEISPVLRKIKRKDPYV